MLIKDVLPRKSCAKLKHKNLIWITHLHIIKAHINLVLCKIRQVLPWVKSPALAAQFLHTKSLFQEWSHSLKLI